MLRAVLLSVSTLGMTLLTLHDASSQSSEFMSDVQRSALHDFRVIPAVEGLESPWSINWLPNGDMLITEKAGRLRIARNGELLQAAVTSLAPTRRSTDGHRSPQGGDELNIIKPATNYGWPVVGRGVNYGFGAPIHPTITRRDMENPIHFWVPSIATSGLMIYTGARFPQWYGNIFSGGLAGMQLARLTLNQDSTRVSTEETLLPGIGRIRDVRQGPDGDIYLAIEDMNRNPTSIVRLEPTD